VDYKLVVYGEGSGSMKFFLDTEFIATRGTLELISVGIYCENGRSFYAESSEYDVSLFSQWHYDNIQPGLKFFDQEEIDMVDVGDNGDVDVYGTYKYIGTQLKDWVNDIIAECDTSNKPEFWGWFCSTDWVLFCWLFGDSLVDIPKPWPQWCRDILQEIHGPFHLPTKSGVNHNALDDAKWHFEIFQKNGLGD